MNKLQVLCNEWSSCVRCPFLLENRHNVVFGYGQHEKRPILDNSTGDVIGFGAQVLIIGEAPGVNEDKQGLPFVGKSGAILDQYLASTSARAEVIAKHKEVNESDGKEYERNSFELRQLLTQEFFFTNVVACRPPENRDPTPKEVSACRSRLMEIIYIVDPVIIIGVGRIAVESLIGRKVTITQVKGQMFDIEFSGKMLSYRYPVIATLHPSYLMRKNDFNRKGSDGHMTYVDFLRAMHVVDAYNWRHHGIVPPKLRPKLSNK
jgi:uracil-DNA glycosylase family 4